MLFIMTVIGGSYSKLINGFNFDQCQSVSLHETYSTDGKFSLGECCAHESRASHLARKNMKFFWITEKTRSILSQDRSLDLPMTEPIRPLKCFSRINPIRQNSTSHLVPEGKVLPYLLLMWRKIHTAWLYTDKYKYHKGICGSSQQGAAFPLKCKLSNKVWIHRRL